MKYFFWASEKGVRELERDGDKISSGPIKDGSFSTPWCLIDCWKYIVIWIHYVFEEKCIFFLLYNTELQNLKWKPISIPQQAPQRYFFEFFSFFFNFFKTLDEKALKLAIWFQSSCTIYKILFFFQNRAMNILMLQKLLIANHFLAHLYVKVIHYEILYYKDEA